MTRIPSRVRSFLFFSLEPWGHSGSGQPTGCSGQFVLMFKLKPETVRDANPHAKFTHVASLTCVWLFWSPGHSQYSLVVVVPSVVASAIVVQLLQLS